MAVVDIDSRRLHNRKVDEFIGVCRVLAAKSALSEDDVRLLDQWLDTGRELGDAPLTKDVFEAVDEAVLSNFGESDVRHLHDIIRQFVGGAGSDNSPTALPLDVPAPPLTFAGKRYCFTGAFAYGTRRECEEAIRQRGGTVGDVSSLTDVLVIGSKLSGSWRHSSYGRKIVSAVRYNEGGAGIAIVTEGHWKAFLEAAPITGAIARPPRPRKPDVGDQIAQLWDLFDSGAITREEMDKRLDAISPGAKVTVGDVALVQKLYMEHRRKVLRQKLVGLVGNWKPYDVAFTVATAALLLMGFMLVSG